MDVREDGTRWVDSPLRRATSYPVVAPPAATPHSPAFDRLEWHQIDLCYASGPTDLGTPPKRHPMCDVFRGRGRDPDIKGKRGLVFVRWRSHAPAQLFAPIDNEMRACLRPRAHVMGHNMEPRKIRSFMRVGKRLRGGTETPRMEHAVFAKQSRIRSE